MVSVGVDGDGEALQEALDLDELKALCAAATEGPWEWRKARYDPVIVGAGSDWPHGKDEAYATVYGPRDAEFIAAARSALPALIAEVERLTVERDEARSALESVRDFAVAVEKQNHEARKVLLRHLNEDASDDPWLVMDSAARILGDDETETQQ